MAFILSALLVFSLTYGLLAEPFGEHGDGEVLDRVRRVIGGRNAGQGDWPWMGSLRSEFDDHLCGAILISEQAAITAAHCRESDGLRAVSIVLGNVALDGVNSVRRQFQFIPHDAYDAITDKNDIALLWFTQPVQFNDNIQPAIITRSRDEATVYSDCTVTGWGSFTEVPVRMYPNILQVAEVDLYGPQQCAGIFNTPEYCGAIMLCAGIAAGGVDTCDGDSGGPVQCRRNPEEPYEVVGITSFSFHGENGLCAQPNNPTVYTRLSSYMTFITQTHGSNTPQNFQCPVFTLTATGAQARIEYTTPICVLSDGRVGFVFCSPASGATVVLPTVVTCTCFDPSGDQFEITCPVEVEDAPPVIGSCPTNIQLIQTGGGQTTLFYTLPTCTDSEDGPLPVSCTPAPFDTVTSPRQISCTCTDSAGSTDGLNCAVDSGLTALPCPPPIMIVDGRATWTAPDCVVNGVTIGASACSPPSGTSNSGTVNCVCSNGGQQNTCTFELFLQSPVVRIFPCPPTVLPQGNFIPPNCVSNSRVVGVSVCALPIGTSVTCTCTVGGSQDTCTFDTGDNDCMPNTCGIGQECRAAGAGQSGPTCHRFMGSPCSP